jgi:hypothetical protein
MKILLRAALIFATIVMVLGTAAPARAHTRVFAHGFYPVPYAYGPYPFYAYPPYPYAYPYVESPAIPPPGWEAGHWEWRKNRWGRWVEVWVPPHLR